MIGRNVVVLGNLNLVFDKYPGRSVDPTMARNPCLSSLLLLVMKRRTKNEIILQLIVTPLVLQVCEWIEEGSLR